MDVEDGGKPRPQDLEKPTVGFDGSCLVVKAKASEWPFVVLRVLAICATLSATLVMALNKQSKTMVVALVGNTPITGTVTAKFQQTPAFVFFVIANAIASFHNISLLLLRLYGSKLQIKGLGLLVTISDMMMVSLVSAAAAGAAAMAELGKNGNTHARWNKICDRFETFCDHGGGALIASFISVGLLMALNALSTVALYKNRACR
ncbi:CASP-like protein 1B1 [Magnolia sinica]|uniref:CASP-like protein 1B1 n=1 Tax=Magnolia sinica TaxID=86752 RepID=UPI00265A16E7|nr:CASP-like protein 1B1 [Magnolia sinica]